LAFRQMYVSVNSCFHCPFHNPSAGTNRKHSSSVIAPIVCMGTCFFAKALPSDGRVYLLIKNLLPSYEYCFFVWFEAVSH
jgi:hypothetical protein